MGVVDRIANVQEPAQQLAKLQVARSLGVVRADRLGAVAFWIAGLVSPDAARRTGHVKASDRLLARNHPE